MNRQRRVPGNGRTGFTRRPRRGVTLVELIVAMTILAVGLLAIVGTSATIARSLGEARAANLAAIHAESRFEQLAGTACTSLTLGTPSTAESRGISESWVVTEGVNATREVVNTVSWKTRSGTRSQQFTTLLPCRPGA
ncbi:MAG: prepilin-type N-terminal cleavage/methylation domain-containing protein [Gemmatimonadaceae bacterium]